MRDRPHLVLGLEYPLGYGGGVSVIVRTLLESLRSEFQLSLVSPDTREEVAASGFGWVENHLSWPRARASSARARQLAAQVCEWKADLAHFHCGGNYGWGNRRPGTSPLPYLKRAGVPCVTTVHSVVTIFSDLLGPDAPLWKLAAALPVAWLGKMSALRGTAVEIAASEHDLRLLQRWYAPARRRFRRVYHSQLPATPPPRVPDAEREKVILHVGHRAERKGQDVLVQAFRALVPEFPKWRLRFVGPPGEPAYERALAGSRIELLGPRDDVPALLQHAAIYAQPSRQEALGLALQEAMFHGCAVAGTRVGGIPELIDDDRSGLLVRPDDVPAMAGTLRRLMSEAALRERLGSAAPAQIVARGMTSAGMVEAHRALYEEVLRGR